MPESPLVTAVIPTRNRPVLVKRAVHSALNQTYPGIEVVVVVDGPDGCTCKELATISDSRLRVIELPSAWAAPTRAIGEWIPREASGLRCLMTTTNGCRRKPKSK